MKVILLLSFAALLYATPVYLFDTLVMPELNKLQQTYSNADTIAENIVRGASPQP